MLPQGHYQIAYGEARTSLTALAGGTYSLDLRGDHAVAFSASSEPGTEPESIILRATARGAGRHSFSLRTDNLDLSDPETVSVDLGKERSQVISWHARVVDRSTPWVAVVLQDGLLRTHAELSGVVP